MGSGGQGQRVGIKERRGLGKARSWWQRWSWGVCDGNWLPGPQTRFLFLLGTQPDYMSQHPLQIGGAYDLLLANGTCGRVHDFYTCPPPNSCKFFCALPSLCQPDADLTVTLRAMLTVAEPQDGRSLGPRIAAWRRAPANQKCLVGPRNFSMVWSKDPL